MYLQRSYGLVLAIIGSRFVGCWAVGWAADLLPTFPDIRVITVTGRGHNEGHHRRMSESAARYGFNFQEIKLDHDFSWSHKLHAVQDFACDLPSETVIISVDTSDVIFGSSIDHLRVKLSTLTYKHKEFMLFTGEKFAWPDPDIRPEYPVVASPWRYLNTMLLGNAGFMCSFMRSHLPEPSPEIDDQRWWADQFLKNNPEGNLMIDTGCSIFQSLADTADEELVYTSSGLFNTVTRQFPVIFHGNGPGKSVLGKYADMLIQLQAVEGNG